MSGNLYYLVTVITLGCFLVEVQPREISQIGIRKNEYNTEQQDKETYARNHNLVGDIVDRYLTDLAELRSVPEMRNLPPIIHVYTLYGGEHPQVFEEANPGEFVAFVEITDPDDGPEGMFICQVHDNRFELVKLHGTEYELVTHGYLNYEYQKNLTLRITCADHGKKQVSTKDIKISVLDVNDNHPRFTKFSYEASLIENNEPGTLLLQVHAEDRDTGENGAVMYILSGSARKYLTINRDTGEIFAKAVFHCVDTPKLSLYVIAVDQGYVPLSNRVEVNLTIIGTNDNVPVFERRTYQFSIPEDTTVGTTIGRVQAIKDCNQIIYDLVRYTTSGDAQMFGINNNTGDIVLTGRVDFEEQTMFVLSAIAKNQNRNQSLVAEAPVAIMITDVNDNPPVIEINTLTGSDEAEIKQYSNPGTFVAHVSVHDIDSGDNGKFTCRLTVSAFELVKLSENKFKIVTISRIAGNPGGRFTIRIYCEDLGENPRAQTVIKRFTAVIV